MLTFWTNKFYTISYLFLSLFLLKFFGHYLSLPYIYVYNFFKIWGVFGRPFCLS